MSEMVERVARALGDAHDEGWPDFEGMARAAIAAIREPTEAMINAIDNGFSDDLPTGEVWSAAIDAALKGE